jgi:flagellar biosynthesis/type III secretory pathway protein FliH
MSEEKQTYELISELLKRKDPALVGIRKILRGKSDTLSPSKSFSAHAPEVFNLATEGKSRENETIFNDNEVQTLEFEKKILELQNIISQKKVEIEAAKSAAFEEGKSAGIAENQEKTRAAIEEIENKMKTEVETRLVQQINQELADRKEYFNSLEEDFYQTIKAITRKILATEIQTNPYLIISTIKKAISYISQKDGIKIRVSQDDYEYVKSNIFAFNHNNDGTFKVEIIEDEHIKTGGCLISTTSTIVDAQLEKRAENVFEFIEKIWNESKNDDKSSQNSEEEIIETEEIQDVSEQETL